MDILERILIIQEEKSPKSVASFERTIGKSNGYINSLKKNKSLPGSDVLIKIVENFPEYNTDWLLTGIGLKYKRDIQLSDSVNEPEAAYKVSALTAVENWVIGLIKRETEGKFEELNDNIFRLLKRTMTEDENKESKSEVS